MRYQTAGVECPLAEVSVCCCRNEVDDREDDFGREIYLTA